MGIFQSRPEEPTEWAGLPSEPWEPRSPGEVLPPPLDALDPFASGHAISIDLAAADLDATAQPDVDGGDGEDAGEGE